MSAYARQSLEATGAARVIVVLDGRGPNAQVQSCFSWNKVPEAQRPGYKKKTAPGGAMKYLPNLGVAYGNVDREGWERLLAGMPNVSSISGAPPLRPIRARDSRAAKLIEPVTWGLSRMGVEALWKQGLTGKGVRVGHMDTGVDGKHPALKKAIGAFAFFDAAGDLDETQKEAVDTERHGTHTAGTIAGRKVGGRSIGVAPGCELVSGAVIEGGDELARVLAGVDWAIGEGIRVLNLSLGFPGYWTEFLPILEIIRSKNILPVFAVGNEGPNTSRSPGNYAEAMSVGAIDREGRVYAESSSQRFEREEDALVPDLVMPGVNIISADSGGGYRSDTGTSMAAPHISGLAALLWEAKPEATVGEIEEAILGSCRLPARAEPERANRGLANAGRALKLILEGRAAGAGRLPT
jgi:subtilisin